MHPAGCKGASETERLKTRESKQEELRGQRRIEMIDVEERSSELRLLISITINV